MTAPLPHDAAAHRAATLAAYERLAPVWSSFIVDRLRLAGVNGSSS